MHTSNLNAIKCSTAGIKSNIWLTTGKALCAYLRRFYYKVRKYFVQLSDDLILHIAVKVVDDNAEQCGIFPPFLVLGTISCIPDDDLRMHPQQHNRLRADLAA